MKSIVHIGQMNPVTDPGGVAEHARCLRHAFPELKFIFNPSAGHWAMAEAYNVELLDRGVLNSDTTVIADGYYGAGLAGKVKKLVIAAHGTYAGWLRDLMRNYLPGFEKDYPRLIESAQAQANVYREADLIVGDATLTQEELWEFYRVESEVVKLGIDTDIFKPSVVFGGTVGGKVEATGGNGLKGADIISRLREDGLIIESLGYGYDKAARWREFECFIMPSRHEGGPYVLLEAMASGVSVIAHKTGLLTHDVPNDCVRVTTDLHHGVFARMIEGAEVARLSGRDFYSQNAYDWVRENASLDTFTEGWRRVMGVKS
jgi:glycosyltransferase involved in cell wall biosynthesis